MTQTSLLDPPEVPAAALNFLTAWLGTAALIRRGEDRQMTKDERRQIESVARHALGRAQEIIG